MKRRKWYAAVVPAAGLAAAAVYLSPYVSARENLPTLGPQVILHRATTALRLDAFRETLSYQNNLVPPEINLAQTFNFPLPDAGVRSIALYQDSPTAWRFEELNSSNTVVAVVARAKNRLVTYQASNNHRMVEHLRQGLSTPWTLWQVPDAASWTGRWTAKAATVRFAGHNAYRVTLRPVAHDLLIRRVTYWFEGKTFLPLGMQVTDQHHATVFSVRLESLSLGSQGAAAQPPSAGRFVSWRLPSALTGAAGRLTQTSSLVSPAFPRRLGPLARVSERETGGNALAVYGTGPGRIVVINTSARVFKGKPGTGFFHPISGYSRYEGVTDGVFTVVTFNYHGREIAMLSSRSQQQLARWAEAAWE